MSTNPTRVTPEAGITVSERLTRARGLRVELQEAMGRLELALARPASPNGWSQVVEMYLYELRAALDAHIDEVESPNGLLAEIRETAPRLAAATVDLGNEHIDLLEMWDDAADALRAHPDDANSIRRRITSMLCELAVHRQHGADLVYEAYNVDIGDSN
jgi:hypothetical protein